MEDNQDKEPVIQEYHEQQPRHWPTLLLYGVMALVFAFGVVFGGRAIYRHYHQPTVKTVPANSKQLPPSPTPSASSSGTKSSSTGSGSSSGKGSQTANNNNLPNSGPGQVVGLFFGVSAVAGGLHFLISSQRDLKSS